MTIENLFNGRVFMESRKKQMRFLILVLICSLIYSTWAVYGNPELTNEDFIGFMLSQTVIQKRPDVKDEGEG